MILFICRGNVARSQFAEALARQAGLADVSSAGADVKPEKEGRRLAEDGPFAVNAVSCFKAVTGMDLSDNRRKAVTAGMAAGADRIVSLVDAETLPDFVRAHESKIEYWPIADPREYDVAGYKIVIEEMKSRVAALKKTLPGNGGGE
ncbi:MAG: hypothetical protein JXD23_00500 [Spirochaetales bacterium]|nr:hypothetical protein [Spirochaetales bacterium]